MEQTIHITIEIPLEEPQKEEDQVQESEVTEDSSTSDVVSLGGKVIGTAVKTTGKVLGGVWDVIKPSENGENGTSDEKLE